MIVRYRTRPQYQRASSTRAAEARPTADAFLSAEVGVQANGMTLSVLSMLARQDLDPYGEMRHLATLDRGDAVARLTAILLKAPVEPPSIARASALASDLLSRLPDFEADALYPVIRRSDNPTQRYRSEVFGRATVADPSREVNPLRSSVRKMHYARLVIAVVACLILITIGLVQPRAIMSPSGGQDSSNATTETAPAASARPHLYYH